MYTHAYLPIKTAFIRMQYCAMSEFSHLYWRPYGNFCSLLSTSGSISNFSLLLLPLLHWVVTDKTVKLWKISERCRHYSDLNTITDDGMLREKEALAELRIPRKCEEDISVEALPRRIFSNAHAYHINSISVNSDDATYLSADDLRINVWHLEITDQSFSILPPPPLKHSHTHTHTHSAYTHARTHAHTVVARSPVPVQCPDRTAWALCNCSAHKGKSAEHTNTTAVCIHTLYSYRLKCGLVCD